MSTFITPICAQVLNDSELVDFVSYSSHPDGAAVDGYYFVKSPIWRSSGDVAQLRRLERSVNLTMHESQTDNSKILDVRVHLPGKRDLNTVQGTVGYKL